jgi:hypothetical protein
MGFFMSVVLPIEDDDRFEIYTASDGQKVFAINFPFQDDGDIGVYAFASDNWNRISSIYYTVTGAGEAAGGAVTLATGRTAGDKILVIGEATLERLSSIVRAGKFSSKATDDEFDRNRIIQQEQSREISRSVRMVLGGGAAPQIADDIVDNQLLALVNNKIIGVDVLNLGTPTDAAEVLTALGLKADLSYVDAQLADRAIAADVYDKTEVDILLDARLPADGGVLESDLDVDGFDLLNVGNGGNVLVKEAQPLTDAEQLQIRTNIGARTKPDAIIFQKFNSGTAGGGLTASTWTVRPLNDKYDPDNLITLASSIFTPSVNGRVEWEAVAYSVNAHVSRLWNVTDNAEVDYRSLALVAVAGANVANVSTGAVDVVAGKTYRLEHNCTATKATNGQGDASGLGTEYYAFVRFWKN